MTTSCGGLDKRTVLVAEPDILSAKLVQAALSESGCRVLIAASFAEALAIVDAAAPDLALIDDALPDLRGIELVRAIKSTEKYRDTVVVLTSSRSGSEFEREVMSLGCAACFQKPIDPLALPTQLAELLKQ